MLKLVALLLRFVSTLAEILAVLLKHFDALLQDLVVLGRRGAPGVKLVHLIVVEFNLTCEVLATAFEGAHLILKLVVLQFDLRETIAKLLDCLVLLLGFVSSITDLLLDCPLVALECALVGLRAL